MKKKFLSLMMAAAVVASTSVSAFATERTHEIQSGKEKEVEVKVEGNISAHDGSVLPSTVTVTVPTSANFTVDQSGELSSSTISIKNSGDTAVLVIASEFIDSDGSEGINVVKSESDLNNTRKNVTLKITGGEKDAILTSEANNNNNKHGKIYKADGSALGAEEELVIGKATKDTSLDLKLTGKGVASSGDTDKAIQNNFKLVLKIKQASK